MFQFKVAPNITTDRLKIRIVCEDDYKDFLIKRCVYGI